MKKKTSLSRLLATAVAAIVLAVGIAPIAHADEVPEEPPAVVAEEPATGDADATDEGAEAGDADQDVVDDVAESDGEASVPEEGEGETAEVSEEGEPEDAVPSEEVAEPAADELAEETVGADEYTDEPILMEEDDVFVAPEEPLGLSPMADGYQELQYNAGIIAQIGNQKANKTNGCNPNSQCKKTGKCACCGLYSAAYANSMFDGVAHSRIEYSNGSTAALYWGKAGLTKHKYSSSAQALRACYDEINAGRPVVLGVTMPGGSWHYVCVIGYQNVSDPNAMGAGNIIALDPYYGDRRSLSGYTISRGGSIEAGLFSPSKGKVPFVTPPDTRPMGSEMATGYDRVLPDGDYAIVLTNTVNSDPFYYLDIFGAAVPADHGTNVGICSGTGKPASLGAHELWHLSYADGFYTITQVGTSMCLDVQGADRHSDTNICVASSNGGSAQKWAISRSGDGYRLQAKCSGFVLDNSGGRLEKGNNVIVWEGNDSVAQRWSFVPVGHPISEASVASIGARQYTRDPLRVYPDVIWGGKTLVEGTDYTLSFKNNVNPGTATITITGKGPSFTGTKTVTFEIVKRDLSVTYMDFSEYRKPYSFEYTGKAIHPEVRMGDGIPGNPPTFGTLKEGSDYTLKWSNNVNAGTATVTATGINNCYGSQTLTFEIVPASISGADVTVPDISYTGSARKPVPTVVVGGRTLNAGTDFTVSYKDNVNIGTATVTITGKGNYTGSCSATFKIVEKPTVEEGEARPFRDCDATTPHYGDILWLYGAGVTQGWEMQDGTREFRPFGSVARCDMAAFLYRLAGSPDFTPTDAQMRYFSDVDSSTPHAKEVWWLVAQGISKGWTEDDGTHTFRPYNEVARCDMAAFLYRMAGSPAYEPTPAERGYFSDIDSTSPHVNEVWWLASTGVSRGWDEPGGSHTFRPYNEVARCDMAAFLQRMAEQGMIPQAK